jgi:hypothetical protein
MTYCTNPKWLWMILSVKQLVEFLAGETEVLRENLAHCHFAHRKSHLTWARACTWATTVLSWWPTAWAMTRRCAHLTSCSTFVITVQLQLMLNHLLFIVNHIICYNLTGHDQGYKLLCWRNLLFWFSYISALGYFYVSIVQWPCTF